jgi:hypothetical protein
MPAMNSPTHLNETLTQLLDLSADQRAALAHGLLLSLEDDEATAPDGDGWTAELESRLDAADREEFAHGDWRDVIARIRSEVVAKERA